MKFGDLADSQFVVIYFSYLSLSSSLSPLCPYHRYSLGRKEERRGEGRGGGGLSSCTLSFSYQTCLFSNTKNLEIKSVQLNINQ